MLKTITRQLFARLNRHLPYRLVHRDPLPGAQTAVNATIPPSLSERCLKVAAMEQETLWRVFDTHPEGLNAAEVTRAREKHGENRLPAQKPSPWWVHLWVCYRNPFNILLTILGGISYATEDLFAAGVIALMVGISTLLNFVQEARSTKAADALKAMVSNTATVLRVINENGENAWLELPIDQLVPGDIIKLAAGDMIPADLRIIQARDLFVAQASLTGESLPVEKVAATREPRQNNPLECDTLCFMGTNVVSGTAQAVVMATGAGTWFGQLAGRVSEQDNEQNAFQKGISRVSMLLIRFMLVMAPVVLIINGYTKGDWWEAALFALSVAVGLTPEMLPMIVTSTLARGAVKLSKQKVIVKHLDAIQNFGAMDILCTDKTGTLTQDKIVLENHTDISGKPSEHVLHCAWLNSHYQTGLKNLLDTAVLEGVDETAARQLSGRWQKIDEIPFDFERRRMSVVVVAEDSSVHQLVCKGALQEILNVCTQVRHNGDIVPLDDNMLRRVKRVTDTLNRQGLRVVAVATKYLPAREGDYQRIDESDLILEGYIAFLDPPKETTAPALKALKASGITVKILTGDSELVAAKVCHEVGLDAGDVIIGSDIEGLSDDALAALAARTTLFARLTPMHKERIVTLLKREGHVVGFMGDGINDAPALRAADIGISVDGAVDIAREAADIILLEKSLMVLEEGVIEGRRTFSNMLKYIKMTASSNFGNVFSVLVASAFLPFLPMLPLHLLIQNLLYDVSQVAIPFDNVDEEQIQKPQRWNPADLGRFMVFFGPISSIFDILTFCLMWWVFHANTPETQTLFQSGWFVVGLLSQTLIVHMIRTRRLPFIQSRAAWPLMAMTLLVMVVGVSLPFSPLASYLQLQALPLSYFPWLIAILAGYMTLTQLVKGFYSRRYGWQ
ncbi:TPA: magnesium-translocating P-type ATPase [Salmonella enterica subsp. enterica serovar Neukoelln]|uniref:magnesium-translocating P-type ATPase n=1 Tax=Salmonella enterica TaxID=28901 RepID=UPI000F932E6F|nr:magnesium-translocating P-type ATPase [Salmonella enterica subsp. enterica serovar Neukoelln]EAC0952146.1 magnesium-translocating P-type ATPase [Salmonella enterica subsp. enterica]EBZ6302153.1 magnesium-translocating P-type ATPase [Salmonella enterica subsp. enterica serovar Gombe]EHC0283052.1 magnesium-translocating P-type ATPase [Salmonella enterica]EAB9200090.1 magnesium-translocating P-type ATPase [Salmonella enterica subsp. enterica serovar Neukoelln]